MKYLFLCNNLTRIIAVNSGRYQSLYHLTRSSYLLPLKKIEAIIRPEKLPIVKEKLRQIGVGGMTISTVSGWSKQRELHLQWRGQPVAYDLLPKAKFEFVNTVEQAINISTLDKGDAAILQPEISSSSTNSVVEGQQTSSSSTTTTVSKSSMERQ